MTVESGLTPQIMVWRQVHWPQPLDAVQALAVLRAWAADQHSPRLVLEARSSNAKGSQMINTLV
jgi:hypothetical protein